MFIFLFLILFTYSFKPILFDAFSVKNLVFGDIEYSIYCKDIEENIENSTIIDNGNSYIIKTNINNAKNVKGKSNYILGESVRFKSTINGVEKLIKFYDANVVKTECVENIVCVYAFSEKLSTKKFIEIDNQKINLQIAFSNNFLTIGTPIILGDY